MLNIGAELTRVCGTYKGAVNGGPEFLMRDASSLDLLFFSGFAPHVQGCVNLYVVRRTTDHLTTLKLPPLVVAHTQFV